MIREEHRQLSKGVGKKRTRALGQPGERSTATIAREPSSWTALIIEDDRDNLDLVQRVLTYHQVAVYLARNGQEGLEILEHLTPTFILMDLSMPGMDGWTVLEQIRARPETAHLPVIALTAHALQEIKDQVLDHGFDGYISKPFQVAHLLDQIKGCIQAADAKHLRG